MSTLQVLQHLQVKFLQSPRSGTRLVREYGFLILISWTILSRSQNNGSRNHRLFNQFYHLCWQVTVQNRYSLLTVQVNTPF
jgi:hypothetical protein